MIRNSLKIEGLFMHYIWSNEDILNKENTKNLNYTNYVYNDYRILTITIQFKLLKGQLISKIQKPNNIYYYYFNGHVGFSCANSALCLQRVHFQHLN